MSTCCFADSILADSKQGMLSGSVMTHNVCPCGSGCPVDLQVKPNWDGFHGTSGGSVNFDVDISCSSSQYRLSITPDQSSCGSISNTPIFGSCDVVVADVIWTPSGSACCGSYPGEASAMRFVISDAVPSLPPTAYPHMLPPCEIGTALGQCCPQCQDACSSGPVLYATGEVILNSADVQTSGFGLPFGHTRSFSSRLTASRDPGNGFNWFVDQWPFLQRASVGGQSYVVVMGGSGKPLWFSQLAEGSYQPTFGGMTTLTLNRSARYFETKTLEGVVTRFDMVTGKFLSKIYPSGQSVQVTALTSSQTKIAEIQQSYTSGGSTVTQRFSYAYTQPFDQQLASVTVQRKVDAGSWENVQRAIYSYYASNDQYGDLGDLKCVTTQLWQNSAWVTTGTSYYRYWVTRVNSSSSSSSSQSSNSSSSTSGQPLHLVKYVVDPAAYDRIVAAGYDPLTVSEATLSTFADYYFEYDSQRRVTKETIKSGSQTFTFAYAASSFANGYNSWSTKTTETLPDGNQNVIYSNYAGQPMLKVFKSGSDQWITFFKYDSTARITLKANPSAVTGYDESKSDLLNFNSGTGKYQYLRDSAGLIATTVYDACTGYVSRESLQQGQLGASIKLKEYTYTCCGGDCACGSSSSSSSSRSSSSSSSSSSLPNLAIWYLGQETAYPSDTDPTKTIVTSYSYSFYPGTCAVQQKITTLPVISTAQNGLGTAATRRDYYDLYGNPTWMMDERGFISRMVYDIATGALTQRVDDVDTSIYTDEPAGWTTPSGGGLNVITDMVVDSLGRTTQILGPAHTVDLNGTATTIRTASWNVYDDASHDTYSGRGFATGSSPSYTYTLVNPVSITKMDAGGRVDEQIGAASSNTNGSLSAIITAAGSGAAAFPQASYVRWTTNQYTDCCLAASQRVYRLVPASGAGSSGTNYDETDYGYDLMKRRYRTVTPGGTITELVYDARGNVTATYVGTNDTGATMSNPAAGGPPNNMVVVTTNVYDGGIAGGDGNRTQTIQHVDGSTTRTTSMIYDFRNRQVAVDGEVDDFAVRYFDNLDRVIKNERYDTSGPIPGSSSSSSSRSSGSTVGNLIARKMTSFDDQGRVYQSIVYGVDPTTGIVGNALTDNFWFDASGNQIKALPAGSQAFAKTTYDSLGRASVRYSGFGTDANYAAVTSVSNNTIMEQTESTYDSTGFAIQSTLRQRYHNAAASQLGSLQNPNTTPKARVIYTAIYPDATGRRVASAEYGTNGGTSLSRSSTIPARSDTILITSATYDWAGNQQSSTDPAGIVTRLEYDAAGRKSKETQNYRVINSSSSSSSISSSSGGCSNSDDTNLVTRFTYTPDGLQATLTAENVRTGNQTTTWTYGTTLSDSAIASSQLLRSLAFPDSTGGSDLISYSYNRRGEKTTQTDQRGCVHTYEFDKLGRMIHDRVTTLGTGVDGAVLRLTTAYEVRGMANKLTSYDNATVGSGSIVNECQFTFNSFGQLIAEHQSHSGAVNTTTTPKVQYSYANGSTNTIRQTSLIYPNSRVLAYDYGTASSINDSLSRVGSLIDNDGTTHLADYSYVGSNSFVIVDYSQPDVEYILADLSGTNDPDTGDIYSGWDRFGRVKDCRWYNYGNSTDVARLKYGYDQDSNRLWRQDTVAQSLGKAFDELYTYDGVNRLKDMQRGTLNGAKNGVTSTNFEQCWTPDSTNNWPGFRESTNGSSWTTVQSRTSNTVNEITNITNSTGSAWVTPAYDAAGNSTTIPQPTNPGSGYTGTYDAWNRLVKLVNSSGGASVQQNQFDARNFRTLRLSFTAGVLSETRDFYYSASWQSIEEKLNGSTSPERQLCWGIRYVDDLVLRDRDTTSGGTLNERLYCMKDANWNTVLLIGNDGIPKERYLYSAFGQTVYLNGNMSSVVLTSSFGSEVLYTGQQLDAQTGLFYFRNRFFSPTLGNFLTRDPVLYNDGPSLYAAWFAPNTTDATGLSICKGPCPGYCEIALRSVKYLAVGVTPDDFANSNSLFDNNSTAENLFNLGQCVTGDVSACAQLAIDLGVNPGQGWNSMVTALLGGNSFRGGHVWVQYELRSCITIDCCLYYKTRHIEKSVVWLNVECPDQSVSGVVINTGVKDCIAVFMRNAGKVCQIVKTFTLT